MRNFQMIIVAVCCMAAIQLWAAPDSTNFGQVTLQVNDAPVQTFRAKSSKLYRNVAIEFQDVLQVQSKSENHQYYYAQFSEGESSVLHLIIESDSLPSDKMVPANYDIYIDLGKNFAGTVDLATRDSAVFVFPNGKFPENEMYSSNQSGTISIDDTEQAYGVSGAFNTTFNFPSMNAAGMDTYKLQGELVIPNQNLITGGKTGFLKPGMKRGQYTRNILIAVGLAAAITALVFIPQ